MRMMVEMHGVSSSHNGQGGGGNGNGGPHVPAFLAKLWKLVDDPETNSLIYWSDSGHSFIIRNQAMFARELLPLYYKHNNMASFIRQLNMYGFHKVVSVDQGGLKLDKDEMEFAHPFFLRGHETSLELIKRKISIPKHDDSRIRSENLQKVLMDVKQMKGKQEKMDVKLSTMKQENEALWEELSSLRHKHANQTTILSKILQFLMGVMQSRGNHQLGFKRRFPLMIEGTKDVASTSSATANNSSKPIIRDVTDLLGSIDEPIMKSLVESELNNNKTNSPEAAGMPTFMEVDQDHITDQEGSPREGRRSPASRSPGSPVKDAKDDDVLQIKDTVFGGNLGTHVEDIQAELNDIHELLQKEKFMNLDDSSSALSGIFGQTESPKATTTASVGSSGSPHTERDHELELGTYSPSLFELTDDSHFFDDSSNIFLEDELQNVMATATTCKDAKKPVVTSSIPFTSATASVSGNKRKRK